MELRTRHNYDTSSTLSGPQHCFGLVGSDHRTQGVSRITRSFTGVNCLLRYRVSDQDHGPLSSTKAQRARPIFNKTRFTKSPQVPSGSVTGVFLCAFSKDSGVGG